MCQTRCWHLACVLMRHSFGLCSRKLTSGLPPPFTNLDQKLVLAHCVFTVLGVLPGSDSHKHVSLHRSQRNLLVPRAVWLLQEVSLFRRCSIPLRFWRYDLFRGREHNQWVDSVLMKLKGTINLWLMFVNRANVVCMSVSKTPVGRTRAAKT